VWMWRKPVDELTVQSGVMRRGSVVEHQLGLDVCFLLIVGLLVSRFCLVVTLPIG
jgi:hypothetical protein